MLVSICILFLSATLSVMAIKGSPSQACAACKYQRRKCSKDCPLAPFFPADQPEKFQCAHRLYGVRNIMSILKHVKPECREDAMTSIIFESTMRARFPVYGCVGIINQLQNELDKTTEELRVVKARITMCKEQKIPLYDDSFTPHNLELAIVNANLDQRDLFQSNISTPIAIPLVANYDIANCMSQMYINEDGMDKIQNPSFDLESQEYPIQQEGDASHQCDDISCDHCKNDDHKQSPCDSSAEASLTNNIMRKEKLSEADLNASISSEERENVASCVSLTREHIRKIETAAA